MKHILILEDDDSLLKLYTLGLKYAGYQVTGIQTLDQLYTMLNSFTFDLLISDLHIGQVTSEFVVHTLAQLQREKRLPVLVVTGNTGPHLAMLDHFKLAYLQKPFINSVLVSTVQNMLGEPQTAKSH